MITFLRLCFLLIKMSVFILFYAISVCWGGVLVLLKVMFSCLYRNTEYQHNDRHNKHVNIENIVNMN